MVIFCGDVSLPEGTPIAGWFIKEKDTWKWWFRGTLIFRKPPDDSWWDYTHHGTYFNLCFIGLVSGSTGNVTFYQQIWRVPVIPMNLTRFDDGIRWDLMRPSNVQNPAGQWLYGTMPTNNIWENVTDVTVDEWGNPFSTNIDSPNRTLFLIDGKCSNEKHGRTLCGNNIE